MGVYFEVGVYFGKYAVLGYVLATTRHQRETPALRMVQLDF